MKTIKKIQFDTQPIMFVCWPDLGNVGILAIDYIRKKLGMELFAQIDLNETFIHESIVVKDGVASYPSLPECNFYFKKNPDIVIFESNTQLSGKDGAFLIQLILKMASYLKVKFIFTAGGISKSMNLNDKIDIKFVTNNEDTQNFLYTYGIEPLPNGEISGLSSILLGTAPKNEFNVGCFLGTVPAYAYNWIVAYPKASLEIIKIITNILGITIDCDEFFIETKSITEMLKVIDKQIQHSFQNETIDEPIPISAEIISDTNDENIPKEAMEKLEILFDKVSKDKSFALELKKELDKWNVYRQYENRFLDLFKKEN